MWNQETVPKSIQGGCLLVLRFLLGVCRLWGPGSLAATWTLFSLYQIALILTAHPVGGRVQVSSQGERTTSKAPLVVRSVNPLQLRGPWPVPCRGAGPLPSRENVFSFRVQMQFSGLLRGLNVLLNPRNMEPLRI